MDFATSFSAMWTLLVAMCVLAQANPIKFRHHAKRHRCAKMCRTYQLMRSNFPWLLPHVFGHVTPNAPTPDVTTAAAENNSNKRELQQEPSAEMVSASNSAVTSATTPASTSGSSSAAASPPKKTAEKLRKGDKREPFMHLFRHYFRRLASRHHKRQAHQQPHLARGPYEFMG